MKFLKKYNECADGISSLDLDTLDVDSRVFQFMCDYNNKKVIYSFVSDRPGYHSDFGKTQRNYIEEKIGHYTESSKFAGRLWLDSKILAFWRYPEPNVLKNDIIPFLEKELDIDMSDWDIEVISNDGEIDYNVTRYQSGDGWKYNIISLKDYVGSKNSSEEDYQFHLMKQDDPRRKLRKISNFGSRAKKDNRRGKFDYALTKEDADSPFDSELQVMDNDSRTFRFIYDEDNKDLLTHYITDIPGPHSDFDEFDENFEIGKIEDKGIWLDNKDSCIIFQGRLWLDSKIISFWEYPKPNRMKNEIIPIIEEELGIDMEKWKIEIYSNNNKIDYDNQEHPSNRMGRFSIIPLSDYIGSDVPEEEYKQHLMNWEEKNKLKKPDFFGSKADKRPLKWKQALLKSESKINESPNEIYDKDSNNIASAFDDHSNTFLWDLGGKLLWDQNRVKAHLNIYKYYHGKLDKSKIKYPGRLWRKEKIISFWKYPETITKLKSLIKELEDVLDVKIWDNGWKIDILKKDGKFVTGDVWDLVGMSELKFSYGDGYQSSQIPIEEYLEEGESENIFKSRNLPKMKQNDIKFKYAMKREKLSNFNGFKLNENPEIIHELKITQQDSDARPFNFHTINGEIQVVVGNYKENHGDDEALMYGDYPGRIWVKKKIMSFWVYPEPDDFKKYIKVLSDNTNIDFFNNGWKIEVLYDLRGEIYGKSGGDLYNSIHGREDLESKIIPIEEYTGSDNVPEEEYLNHLNKGNIKVPPNFGSRAKKDNRQGAFDYAITKESKRESNIYNFNKFNIFENDERTSFKMDIPEELYQINRLYQQAGKDFFIVGGAVRDAIQGKKPHDFDLVTNALPEETKKILKDWNLSKEEQGQNFGVLRLYTENEPEGYEIASYRLDISKGRDTKGNDEKVEIGNHITLEDDSKRRDLTINALYYDIDKQEIVDLVGGVDDLKNKIVRTVGNPTERFDEDRLRILRTFRFAARSSSKISEETSDAIKNDNRLKGISSIDDVSQERIVDSKNGEFFKMIDNSQSNNDKEIMYDYLKMLEEFNMFDEMFKNLKISKIEKDKFSTNTPEVLFANLFESNNIDDFPKNMVSNGFDSKLSKKVNFLLDLKSGIEDENNAYSLLKKMKRTIISDEIIREYAKTNNLDNRLAEKFIKYSHIERVNSLELMDQGYKGKELGDKITELEIENYKKI
jgi:tRNA nucleotidyltransferase (CCA-adding enzyme)